MRAIAKRSAQPDDIALVEVAVPEIGPDELLVELRAVGVGIHDSYFLPNDVAYPYPIGTEGAGTVAKVGSAVTTFEPGERIAFVSLLQPKGGTWAEFAVLAGDSLILRIPQGMSFEQAAVVPIAGNTALRALHGVPLQSGDALFIAGASGAVGTLAIQLAKARGWRVAASASAANHDYLRSLGADLAADYRDHDWPEQVREWAGGGGVDGAIAIQPGTSDDSMRAVRDGGSLITVSADRVQPQRGISVAVVTNAIDVRRELEGLMTAVAEGTYRLVVEQAYPFEHGLEALRKTQTRHARGKQVILIE